MEIKRDIYLKKLINRMTLELIDPLGQFTKSMINIYNENLTTLEKLIIKVKRSRRNFEQVQQDYYKISHKYRQSENNNTKNKVKIILPTTLFSSFKDFLFTFLLVLKS